MQLYFSYLARPARRGVRSACRGVLRSARLGVLSGWYGLSCAGLLVFGALADGEAANASPSDPPSEASIEALLQAANAQKILDSMWDQIGTMMKQSARQMTQGQPVSPQRQAILESMMQRMTDTMRQTLTWEEVKPVYVKIYRQSFTQAEVDGITKFYKTPAGAAMINKMPMVMQSVMANMQDIIRPMQQKMQAIQQDTARQLQAADGKPALPPAAPAGAAPAPALAAPPTAPP